MVKCFKSYKNGARINDKQTTIQQDDFGVQTKFTFTRQSFQKYLNRGIQNKIQFLRIDFEQQSYNFMIKVKLQGPQKIYKWGTIYKNSKFLNQIWSIQFPNLKEINLSDNKLCSIEGITFVDFPNLVYLQLHTNDLRTVDCLSKCYFPKLSYISLYRNKMSNAEMIVRSYLPQMDRFNLDTDFFSRQANVQNLDFLLKITMKNIYVQNCSRIQHTRTKKKRIESFLNSRFQKYVFTNYQPSNDKFKHIGRHYINRFDTYQQTERNWSYYEEKV